MAGSENYLDDLLKETVGNESKKPDGTVKSGFDRLAELQKKLAEKIEITRTIKMKMVKIEIIKTVKMKMVKIKNTETIEIKMDKIKINIGSKNRYYLRFNLVIVLIIGL